MKCYIALCVITLFASQVAGYGSGAPESEQICQDLTPKHGVDPKTSPNPYKLSVDKPKVKAGEQVCLTISGGNVPFKGFISQGRKLGAQGPAAPVGKFQPGENNKLLNCGDIAGSTTTHTNNNDKNSISLVWTPPAPGSYQLLTSVVQDGETYWVNFPSPTITVS